MKHFLLITMLLGIYFIVVFSCQKKHKPKISLAAHTVDTIKVPPIVDTLLNQHIGYSAPDDKYYLQTWVMTSRFQAPLRFRYENPRVSEFWKEHSDGLYSGDILTYYKCAYSNEINGSFQYIKSNKISEYKKAEIALDSIRIKAVIAARIAKIQSEKAKAAADSVTILTKIQP